jgi:hypothetical protein
MQSLLKANPTVMNYVDGKGSNILHWACQHLKGQSFVAVFSLLSPNTVIGLGLVCDPQIEMESYPFTLLFIFLP